MARSARSVILQTSIPSARGQSVIEQSLAWRYRNQKDIMPQIKTVRAGDQFRREPENWRGDKKSVGELILNRL
jgi:hypothetical protein